MNIFHASKEKVTEIPHRPEGSAQNIFGSRERPGRFA